MKMPPLQPLPLVFTATEADVHKLMQKYGELCRKMALEEAAKFCESQQVNHSPRGTTIFLPFDADQGTHEGMHYAKAIRELIK